MGNQAGYLGSCILFTGASTTLLNKRMAIPVNALFHLAMLALQNGFVNNSSETHMEDANESSHGEEALQWMMQMSY